MLEIGVRKWSREDNERAAVLIVKNPEDILSPALGACRVGEVCTTCGCSSKHCAGHFGLILLPTEVKHHVTGEMIETLLVTPPHSRIDGSFGRESKVKTSLHPITKTYQRIVTLCQKFKDGAATKTQLQTEVDKLLSPKYPDTSINFMLKGKNGMIRQVVGGFRIDNCGRAVFSPDNNLPYTHVALPTRLWQTMGIKVAVVPSNIEHVRSLVSSSRVRMITRPDGTARDLSTSTTINCTVRLGDVIERNLMDGDVVLVNRQPTLHRYSMIGFYVVCKSDPNDTTISLNLSVVGRTLNADCDGDELNIYAPYDEVAAAEIELNAMLYSNAINKATKGSMIGLIQHAVIGLNRLTQHNPTDKPTLMQLWQSMSNQKIPDIPWSPDITDAWSLVEHVIPAGVEVPSRFEAGKFVDKSPLTGRDLGGGKENTLVTQILTTGKPMDACAAVFRLQLLGNTASTIYPATLSMKDVAIRSVSEFPVHGHLKDCVDSGAKGSSMNLRHTQLKLGPQLSYGEVDGNLVNGLTARDFYVHARAGRDGLVSKTQKVAASGYVARRLGACLAGVTLWKDGTVRTEMGDIVQVNYPSDRSKVGGPVGLEEMSRLTESVTQLTLRSFQHTGVSSRAVEGLPRFRDLIDCFSDYKPCPEDSTPRQKLDNLIALEEDHVAVYVSRGLFAAKKTLFREMCKVFENPDKVAIRLLVNFIYRTGKPCAITRHGMNKGGNVTPSSQFLFESAVQYTKGHAVKNTKFITTGSFSDRALFGVPILTGHSALPLRPEDDLQTSALTLPLRAAQSPFPHQRQPLQPYSLGAVTLPVRALDPSTAQTVPHRWSRLDWDQPPRAPPSSSRKRPLPSASLSAREREREQGQEQQHSRPRLL